MEQQEQAGELVSRKQAAELLGISRPALDQKLRARGLEYVRRVKRGRVLVYLRPDDLPALELPVAAMVRRASESRTESPESRTESPESRTESPEGRTESSPFRAEAERLRAEVAELRAKFDTAKDEARELRGQLAGAEVVERATARLCDKLEQRVEAMQADLVAQARELGKRDTLVAMLRDQVTDRDQQLEKLEDAPVDVGPWWLPRILKGG